VRRFVVHNVSNRIQMLKNLWNIGAASDGFCVIFGYKKTTPSRGSKEYARLFFRNIIVIVTEDQVIHVRLLFLRFVIANLQSE
ncbi:MAG: hypothetical protein ACI4PM_00200, partial [Butyricicoccus sp.]